MQAFCGAGVPPAVFGIAHLRKKGRRRDADATSLQLEAITQMAATVDWPSGAKALHFQGAERHG
jgi:hypothetical protein